MFFLNQSYFLFELYEMYDLLSQWLEKLLFEQNYIFWSHDCFLSKFIGSLHFQSWAGSVEAFVLRHTVWK